MRSMIFKKLFSSVSVLVVLVVSGFISPDGPAYGREGAVDQPVLHASWSTGAAAGKTNPVGSLTENRSTADQPVLHTPRPSSDTSSVSRAAGNPLTAATSKPDPGGKVTTTIDFEGVGDLSSIPEFDGITSPGWLGIIDEDAGGSGNFAFEPSPSTIAFWLGDPAGSRDIDFARPVSDVGFFYASYVPVTLEAFDKDGKTVAVASAPGNWNRGPGGDPNGTFNKWDPLGVHASGSIIKKVRVTGNVNQTGIDNLTVSRRFGINSVEFTQAIQVWQTLDDLKADLAGDGKPPIPMVAKKPAAMRVYMEEVDAATDIRIEISGIKSESRVVSLRPGSTPEKQRRQQDGCRSIDFYFTPPSGRWAVTVKTLDKDGKQIETHSFTLASVESDALVLRGVSVYDSRDASGNWLGAQATSLSGLVGLLRKIAPTDDVRVDVTSQQVRRDTATYATVDDWWTDTIQDINDLFSLWDRFEGVLGEQRYYYGMIRPALAGGTGGMANDIPSRGAASRTSVVRLGVETSSEVVAHETGHMLGRRHTNTDQPQARGGTPPGSYNLAVDPATDWPYANNMLLSGPLPGKGEVGFDVASGTALLPESTLELMSYSTPRWVSPLTYLGMLNVLDPPSPGTASTSASESGNFWLVSGSIRNGSLLLRPLFTLETKGSKEAGAGSHRIEVRDGRGAVLFRRFFTPSAISTETSGGESGGPVVFSQAIPVYGSAHRIVVFDSQSNEIGAITLGGVSPTVHITPAGEEVSPAESRTVAWSVDDPDSTSHWYWVLYSNDGGTSWQRISSSSGETSLVVNFDELPGSTGNSLVRVLASDGVNTGAATSGLFAVPTKLPEADILSPADGSVFQRGQLVRLEGRGFDGDDGTLSGKTLRWDSDIAGFLGNGDVLPTYGLSEGAHRITLTVKDADGNTRSDTHTVRVDGTSPVLSVSVVPDGTPAYSVRITMGATDELHGSGLDTVEYSLNGGTAWDNVPLGDLPLDLVVRGRGFYHLVVHARDKAGNSAAADARFFIEIGSDLTIATTALPVGEVDVAYSTTLAATGGGGAYTWSTSAGSLPAGLSLDSVTGLISGKPTSAGAYDFTVQVNDGVGTATKSLSAIIYPALVVTTASLPNGDIGVPYSQTLAASGGSGACTWSVSAGSLPSGLSLGPASGHISGQATTAGAYDFVAQVTDSLGTATKPLSITIFAGLVVSTSSLPNGDIGVAYSQALTASGGSGAYSWSISAGSLPRGLSFDPASALISGTPTNEGTYDFTAQVTDGVGAATKSLSVMIGPAIRVTIPNGGEAWPVGDTRTITWESAGITGNVNIHLSRDGGATWTTVISSIPNTGSKSWKVTGPVTAQARIRIATTGAPTVSHMSDANFILAQSVTVVSPNGGETWQAGSTQTISWTSSGLTGMVKIELSRNGGITWSTIVPSAPVSTGSKTWQVSGAATTRARVRVSGIPGGAVADASEADFTITSPTIELTAPNGGETWTAGSTQTISWTSSGLSGMVKIELSRDSGITWSAIVSSVPVSPGSKTWKVSGTATTNARVRVSSLPGSAVSDTGNADFTITGPPPPSITVTSPNGGENWPIGSSRTVTWSSVSVTGNVKIELSRNSGSTWTVIVPTTGNSGSKTWVVTGPATANARVRVTSLSSPSASDASNANFTIPPPSILVTSPNGGENWSINSTRTISWTSVSVAGNVKMEISRDGEATWKVIVSSAANTGSKTWKVTSPATTHARVRVTSLSSPTASDASNSDFSITAP